MMPSASDLTYFLEAAMTLNLSRAAERLGISQPSLSLAIQRLEHSVGVPLLIRGKKGVALTQPGKLLSFHAKDLLHRWDEIKGQALASISEIRGCYTIGCHVSVALFSLPKFMAGLMEDHPGLEVKLVHDLSRKIAERVIQMEVDIGIVVNPVKHPDLVIRKLCDDEVTFWVGKGGRQIQDFRSGQAVLIGDPDLIQTQVLLKKLRKSGIGYRRLIASSSLEVITQLTASGAGLGVIPGRVAAAGASGLRPIPRAPVFHDEISLIYRVEKKSVKAIEKMVERIALAFEKE